MILSDKNNGEANIDKSQIVVDGDVTDEKIHDLIHLGIENERLDYKELLDFSSDAASKRARINLVCDLIAMANTDGGYIIIGVRETEGHIFEPVGATEDNIKKITSENIQEWLVGYVEQAPKITVKTIAIDSNKYVIAIFVMKYSIPLPFAKDGCYQNKSPSQKPTTKFTEGGLYVRHGSTSRKARREDYARWDQAIRESERRTITHEMGREQQLTDRLDNIINLLGGEPATPLGLNLNIGCEEDIEDRSFRLIASGNPMYMKRALYKEFKTISHSMKMPGNLKNREQTIRHLDINYLSPLKHLIPVWIVLVDYDVLVGAEVLSDCLHELYCRVYSIKYPFEENTSIEKQKWIVFLAYMMGAYAAYKSKPAFAKLFLNRGNNFDEHYRNVSWFRYVVTHLNQTHQYPTINLPSRAFDAFCTSDYVKRLFESDDEILPAMCQFDFLQCMDANLNEDDNTDAYPGFIVCKKQKIEPIVEEILTTCAEGRWMRKSKLGDCVKSVKELESIVKKYFHHSTWPNQYWRSSKINNLLRKPDQTP